MGKTIRLGGDGPAELYFVHPYRIYGLGKPGLESVRQVIPHSKSELNSICFAYMDLAEGLGLDFKMHAKY